MVSWLPGDGNAQDIVDSNHGSLVGGVTFPGGMVDQAFSLDGAPGTRVSMPDSANLRFAGSFTFDAWVKTTSPGTQSGAVFNADILRKRHRDDGGLMDIGIGMLDNVARFFLVDDAGATVIAQGTTIINDGQWHHIAGVRDTAAGEAKLFVDGVLEATLTDTTGTFVEVSSVPWNIGNVPGSGSIRFPWDGLIDEVEIFDRALTAAEIKAIYDVGSAGKRKPAPQAAVVDQAYEPASITMATGRLDLAQTFTVGTTGPSFRSTSISNGRVPRICFLTCGSHLAVLRFKVTSLLLYLSGY